MSRAGGHAAMQAVASDAAAKRLLSRRVVSLFSLPSSPFPFPSPFPRQELRPRRALALRCAVGVMCSAEARRNGSVVYTCA